MRKNDDDHHLTAGRTVTGMVSSALAAALARRNIHYGWIVVAVTFLTMLVTAGAMGAPGVLIVPLEREFGWDNTQISTALALRLLLFGVFGPFAAAFMNRFGLRRVMICALALVVAGFVASLAMTHVWQLVLLWGVVIASAPASPRSCSPRLSRRAGSPSAAGWLSVCCRRVRRPGNSCSCR
jgi:MFS family permease